MSRYIDIEYLKKKKRFLTAQQRYIVRMVDIYTAPSIDLADYVPKDFHDKTCEAMSKAHQEEIADMIRVADRPQGKWIDMGDFEQCSVCKGTRPKEFQSYYGKMTWIKTPYCPSCGARMKGVDDANG